jgi:hypothetical protein
MASNQRTSLEDVLNVDASSSSKTIDGFLEVEEVPGLIWAGVLALDCLLYAAFCFRTNAIYQRTVVHYVSWILISDIAYLFLPRKSRNWANVFRFIGGVQLLGLELSLLLSGVPARSLLLVGARVTLCLCRVVSAAILIYRFGPNNRHCILGFLLLAFTKSSSKKHLVTTSHLILGLVVGCLPSIAYQFHYNYKFFPIDVALTGFQGVNALSVFWKLYVCGLFIDSTMLLAILNSLVFLGFAIQWPMMLEMFAAAPLPYLHAVGELAMLVQSIALFVQWRGEKN